MLTNQVVTDAFGRIQVSIERTLNGLSQEDLVFRPEKEANSIGWLIWHLTRIQDDHIADAAGKQQIWTNKGWAERFNLPFDSSATGYGHTSKDVAAVQTTAEQLLSYYNAVHTQTVAFIDALQEKDYERIVDKHWDPPVTLAVRLISILSDDLQHVGQAAYVRGLLP